jgi:hypothetical protein
MMRLADWDAYIWAIWTACVACIIIDHFDGMITNEGGGYKYTSNSPRNAPGVDRSSLLSGVSVSRLYQTSSNSRRLEDADRWLLNFTGRHSAFFSEGFSDWR